MHLRFLPCSVARGPIRLQVTPECKDLLVRLLVADPERRMSMDEIKAHTWFSHALPTGALHMNEWYMSHPSGIDEVSDPAKCAQPLAPNSFRACTLGHALSASMLQVYRQDSQSSDTEEEATTPSAEPKKRVVTVGAWLVLYCVIHLLVTVQSHVHASFRAACVASVASGTCRCCRPPPPQQGHTKHGLQSNKRRACLLRRLWVALIP